MITVRPSAERGVANFGWLDSRHTFSFGHYQDRRYMGHGPLRVINEDLVKPGMGFDTHGHRDMEIISYVLEGALRHKDSLGNGSVIRPNTVQRMTAGTGVRHSEFNASSSEDTHFLQIWIEPEVEGLQPGYEEKSFTRQDKLNQWCLVGSRQGRQHSITIHRDVDLYAAVLEPGTQLVHRFAAGRKGWLQVARGAVELDGKPLRMGDGAALSDIEKISVRAVSEAEVLLFDLG